MACIRFINESQADLHVVELGRMQGPFPSSGSGSTLSLKAWLLLLLLLLLVILLILLLLLHRSLSIECFRKQFCP